MAERTIKHVSFWYYVESPDPHNPDETIRFTRKASKGETVDIPFEADLERGEKFGAFEVDQADAPEAEEVSISELSDAELVDWIKTDHPKVSDVIDSAEGDPDQARRLLDAEDRATGGDSRKDVIEGLTAIVGQAQ